MDKRYNSAVNVNDVTDKKTRDVLMRLNENVAYLKEKVSELTREIELLKRKAV